MKFSTSLRLLTAGFFVTLATAGCNGSAEQKSDESGSGATSDATDADDPVETSLKAAGVSDSDLAARRQSISVEEAMHAVEEDLSSDEASPQKPKESEDQPVNPGNAAPPLYSHLSYQVCEYRYAVEGARPRLEKICMARPMNNQCSTANKLLAEFNRELSVALLANSRNGFSLGSAYQRFLADHNLDAYLKALAKYREVAISGLGLPQVCEARPIMVPLAARVIGNIDPQRPASGLLRVFSAERKIEMKVSSAATAQAAIEAAPGETLKFVFEIDSASKEFYDVVAVSPESLHISDGPMPNPLIQISVRRKESPVVMQTLQIATDYKGPATMQRYFIYVDGIMISNGVFDPSKLATVSFPARLGVAAKLVTEGSLRFSSVGFMINGSFTPVFLQQLR